MTTDGETVDLVADGSLAESGPEVTAVDGAAAGVRPAPVSADVPALPVDPD